MIDYLRTTRECAPAQLKPELLQAIRGYAKQQALGNIEADAVLCFETHSEKKKKGFFASLGGGDPDPVNDIALLVTPTWLIFARSGPKTGLLVSAARLRDIQVSAFESKLIPDRGLAVVGYFNGSAEHAIAYIPLRAEAERAITERVKAVVHQSVA